MTSSDELVSVNFSRDLEVMKLYMESAKNFITLSSAALALTVTFSKDILNETGPIVPDGSLKATWFLLLLSVGAGLLYQYYAGKYIEVRYAPGGASHAPFPKAIADKPGLVYGLMVATFYLGMAVFTLSAFWKIA